MCNDQNLVWQNRFLWFSKSLSRSVSHINHVFGPSCHVANPQIWHVSNPNHIYQGTIVLKILFSYLRFGAICNPLIIRGKNRICQNLWSLGVIKRIETGPIRVISITYHRQLFFRFLTISQIRKFKYR